MVKDYHSLRWFGRANLRRDFEGHTYQG